MKIDRETEFVRTTAQIPHSKPTLGPDELIAVSELVQSNMVAGGAKKKAVEDWFSTAFGGTRTLAVGSGTQAILFALKLLNVGPGDNVITSTMCCSSVLSAIEDTGAICKLVDCNNSYLLSLEEVKKTIDNNTKAIIVPYIMGISNVAAEIFELDIPIIEDFAQSISTTNKLRGAIGVFSFHGSKVVASGEGGLVVVQNPALNAIFEELVSIPGIDQTNPLMPFSDLQASLLLPQLDKLENFRLRRIELAEIYLTTIPKIESVSFELDLSDFDIIFRLPLTLDLTAICPDTFILQMAKKGVSCRKPVSPMIHQDRNERFKSSLFPIANELHRKTISLPLYPSLTNDQAYFIAKTMSNVLNSTSEM